MSIEHLEKRTLEEFSEGGILKELRLARTSIENKCGIKLTNIELFNLRKIAEEVEQRYIKNLTASGKYRFKPSDEIFGQFLLDYYSVNFGMLKTWGWLNVDNEHFDEVVQDQEAIKEWFRKKQQELHDQSPDR